MALPQEICLDNAFCIKWFTADGHLVCRHGLCEKDFVDKTDIHIVCPLELQRLNEEKEWTLFYTKKDSIIKRFLKK